MWQGALAARYWAYTALVMQRRTERIARVGKITEDDYPLGVLRAVQEFFSHIDSVLEKKERSNVYFDFSLKTVSKIFGGLQFKRDDCVKKLEDYSGFVRSLDSHRTLNPEEVGLAKEVAIFFAYLREAGTSDRYLSVVAHRSDW